MKTRLVLMLMAVFVTAGCSRGIDGLFGGSTADQTILATADAAAPTPEATPPTYVLGPGDTIQISVWQNPELSMSLPIRPDGRISMPLVDEMQAAGKKPAELGQDIKEVLAKFIQDPVVTIIVTSFIGPYDQQVRVIGEAARPQSLPYRAKMTILDVMIQVGGLTEFAAGNRAVLVRSVGGKRESIRVALADLIQDGRIENNVTVLPGDIIIIPQSWF